MKLELQKRTNKKHTQFLSNSTKKKLLHLMEENVLKGTGKNAYVKGYDIGGKTATAEKKLIKKEGVYDKKKLVSSFLSIFPIKNPNYICLVLFDEPFLKNNFNKNDGATGGKTAAKTTSKIISRIAPLLGIETKNFYDEMIVNLEKEILILLLSKVISKDITFVKKIEDNPNITGIDTDSRRIKAWHDICCSRRCQKKGINFSDKAIEAGAKVQFYVTKRF